MNAAQLTVDADLTAAAHGAVDEVIASLPVSLAPARLPRVELIALSGSSEDWPTRLAVVAREGARGVTVVAPTRPADAGPDRIPVVVDYEYASNPAVPGAARAASKIGAALLEIRATAVREVTERALLLDLFALARRLGGSPVASSRVVLESDAFLAIRGRLADGRPLLVNVSRTSARTPGAEARMLGADAGLTASFPAPSAARPARVVISDFDGARTLPTLYETSHRATWRRLRDLVHAGGTATDLADLAADDAALPPHD
ncbi:MAG: hypothetical protein FWD85_06810 [Microbacteriaceae bacterium]|nr:hypothetical protein [Microbacteriaceae bacterium]